MTLSLFAAILSLIVLIFEQIAVWNNKRIYKKNKDIDKRGANEKFRTAMKNKGRYKTTALVLLIIASILSTYSNQREGKMSDQKFENLESSLIQINDSIDGLARRMVRVEKFLWGGGGNKNKPPAPSDPTDSPSNFGYLTIEERFQIIEDALSDHKTMTESEIQTLREEVLSLKDLIKEYEKVKARIELLRVPVR